MKITRDLGVLEKDLLIFGGVYSNIHALRKLRKISSDLKLSAEQVICTGDIVGYCAFPEECLNFVKDWGIHSICGNVEIQLREDESDCGCDFISGGRCEAFSSVWYPYALSRISPQSVDWMRRLPDFLKFRYGNRRFGVVHGSYEKTSEYIFESTFWEQKLVSHDALDVDVIVSGHSGIPFFEKQGSTAWINAGVIGMPPNDGTNRVWYTLFKFCENKMDISFHSFTYENESAAKAMSENHLPMEYALTLTSGVWDNTEILAEKEASLSGVPLDLSSEFTLL